MGILLESDGILAFHRCRSTWRDRCSHDPCAHNVSHGQESAFSSHEFLGLIIPIDFTLGLFLSISGLFLPTETHFSGASRHKHPEGPALAEMLADPIGVLPQGYETQREEGSSSWWMTPLWSPFLSRINDVIGILMELSYGGPVTSYVDHSRAGPGRNNRKILESVIDIKCDPNPNSDSSHL